YVTRHIKPVLQEVKGVGEVVYYGARDYAIKIDLDPVKMATYGLTVADLKKALVQQNIEAPNGQIKSTNRYYTVVTHASVQNAAHFSKLVIAQRNNQIIHLSDIASIVVDSENEDN